MITLDSLIPYPRITVIIGGHEPQWVADVLARVTALDEDARIVIMGLMVQWAREEVVTN